MADDSHSVSDALRALARGTSSDEVRAVLDRRDTAGGQSAGSLVPESQPATPATEPKPDMSAALRRLARGAADTVKATEADPRLREAELDRLVAEARADAAKEKERTPRPSAWRLRPPGSR